MCLVPNGQLQLSHGFNLISWWHQCQARVPGTFISVKEVSRKLTLLLVQSSQAKASSRENGGEAKVSVVPVGVPACTLDPMLRGRQRSPGLN